MATKLHKVPGFAVANQTAAYLYVTALESGEEVGSFHPVKFDEATYEKLAAEHGSISGMYVGGTLDGTFAW